MEKIFFTLILLALFNDIFMAVYSKNNISAEVKLLLKRFLVAQSVIILLLIIILIVADPVVLWHNIMLFNQAPPCLWNTF